MDSQEENAKGAARDGGAELDSLAAIELAFMGVFDRLAHQTPEVRGLVLWALSSKWCTGCGLTFDLCDDDRGVCCGVPEVWVTARMCPTCEMIRWDTVTRDDGVPMRSPNTASNPDSEVPPSTPDSETFSG